MDRSPQIPPPEKAARGLAPGRLRWLLAILLAAATGLTFLGVIKNGFIGFDDDLYLTANPMVQGGFTRAGLWWAVTSFHAANWHPLTWLSHMLDVRLFGLAPAGHHLVGLCLHLLNVVLIFLLLEAATAMPWPSAFTAALFALHPLHVESVAWAAERKDLLSTTFWMLTMLAYGRYARKPGPGRYLAVAALFALGLMAKPMLVTLPFVLLLWDYWPLRRLGTGGAGPPEHFGRLLLEKAPLLALAAASSIVTYRAQLLDSVVWPLGNYPLGLRLCNALASCLTYLEKTLLPRNLAVFYPLRMEGIIWKAAVALLALGIITTLVLGAGGKRRYLVTGWFWYLGTLVPVIGLIQVSWQGLADRYTYVPLIGVFIMAAWGANDLAARLSWKKIFLVPAAAAVLVSLAAVTRVQVGHWHDKYSLPLHAIAVVPDNWMGYNLLGAALFEDGRTDEAVEAYRHSLRLNPDYLDARYNLGLALAARGEDNEALDHFLKVARTSPRDPDVLTNIARVHLRLGHYDEAARYYREALAVAPGLADVRAELGMALQGRAPERPAP